MLLSISSRDLALTKQASNQGSKQASKQASRLRYGGLIQTRDVALTMNMEWRNLRLTLRIGQRHPALTIHKEKTDQPWVLI